MWDFIFEFSHPNLRKGQNCKVGEMPPLARQNLFWNGYKQNWERERERSRGAKIWLLEFAARPLRPPVLCSREQRRADDRQAGGAGGELRRNHEVIICQFSILASVSNKSCWTPQLRSLMGLLKTNMYWCFKRATNESRGIYAFKYFLFAHKRRPIIDEGSNNNH